MEPKSTVLCLSSRSGISDCSPIRRWIRMNTSVSPTKPMSSPMIVDELQDFVWPPHCNAKNRQTSAEVKTAVPNQSILRSRARTVRSLWMVRCLNLRNMGIRTNTTPPIGRLLANYVSRGPRMFNQPEPTSKSTISKILCRSMHRQRLVQCLDWFVVNNFLSLDTERVSLKNTYWC
jgi:hypothetical protein